jgi:uncharacterized protein YgiB involved in biofilm formation
MYQRSIFEKTMDWLTDGSMPWAMTKMLSAAIIATGIILSPIIAIISYISDQNEREYSRIMNSIDEGNPKLFTSINACVNDGYSTQNCTVSFENAMNISQRIGVKASYDSLSNCISTHGDCSSNTVIIPVTTIVNKTPITTMTPVTSHTPFIRGWLTDGYNMQNSVPLYNTPDNDQLIRFDGQKYTIH